MAEDAATKEREAIFELLQVLRTALPNWDEDDVVGVTESLRDLIDARIELMGNAQRADERTSGRPHEVGSIRWLAACMVPTRNAAEDIEHARQQLSVLSRRQLIDLVQQLATEVEQ